MAVGLTTMVSFNPLLYQCVLTMYILLEPDHPSCPVALMQQVEALKRERDEKERDRILAVIRLEQWEATFTVFVCEDSKLKKKLAVNERQIDRAREKNAALRSKSGLQKRLIDTYERLQPLLGSLVFFFFQIYLYFVLNFGFEAWQ